jgi:hypothetical protein
MEPMINSGAEREKFSEIVQQVGDTLTYINNINDVSYQLTFNLFVSSKMQLCMEGNVAFFMFDLYILQPSNAWTATCYNMI